MSHVYSWKSLRESYETKAVEALIDVFENVMLVRRKNNWERHGVRFSHLLVYLKFGKAIMITYNVDK